MDPIIIVLIFFTLALVFSIGAADETMSTVVGAGILKLRSATILGSILICGGVFFLSSNVGKTVGASLLGADVDYSLIMMMAVIISTSIWLIVASRTGAPISTTHSIVGAVLGIGILWALENNVSIIDAINWLKIGEVAIGWVISPVFGFFGAYFFQSIVVSINRKQSLSLRKIESSEKKYGYLLLMAVCLTQVSRGGNDSANAIGIFYGLLDSGEFNQDLFLILMILSGICIALGLYFIGKNVIESVGTGLISMKPSDAFSISASTSIVIFICTLLGLPVSGGHILIFSILGSGYVKGERPDRKSFRKMVISWFITFPVAMGLSIIVYYGLMLFV